MKKNNPNVWSSTADVLNDLKAVTGGNPGVSDLDDYVAVGERPPPDRRESINEDEIQYQFGVVGSTPVGNTEPDLDGITQMLHLINDDPCTDNEPKTIFRNTVTDEISISKLNPNVTDFVPSSVRLPQGQRNQENKNKLKSPKKFDHNRGIRKKEPGIKVSCQNEICDVEKKVEEKINPSPSDQLVGENKSTINELKGEHKHSATDLKNTVGKTTVSTSNITLDKKVDVTNMKSDEIEEIKVKIKSKIIDSSGDSIQHKQEKNVAIAALLRLYATAPAVPADKPVKLITPDYFKDPPAKSETEEKESDMKDLNESVEDLEEPVASTSRNPVVYKDPFVEESIAKVNDWFDHEDSPKKKPLPVPVQPPPVAPVPLPPVQFKDVLSFKKKNASSLSINSRISETNSEKKKKQFTAFVPSTYANDLLEKYENNAKSQVAPKEDWRDALERQLKEKDKQIKKKMRDAQDSPSPDARGGN